MQQFKEATTQVKEGTSARGSLNSPRILDKRPQFLRQWSVRQQAKAHCLHCGGNWREGTSNHHPDVLMVGWPVCTLSLLSSTIIDSFTLLNPSLEGYESLRMIYEHET